MVDGGSSDGTIEIARQFGARVIESSPGRARQLNAGALAASGAVFYYLHADTLPPANWWSEINRIENKQWAACCSIRFDRQEESYWLRLFSRLSRWDVDAFRFGDQSLFILREHFFAVGGYQEGHVLLEGHDIVRRLRSAGVRIKVLPATVTTSARRYFVYGVVFTQLMFVIIYGLYRLGAPQVTLVGIYRWAFPNRPPYTGK